MNFLKIIFGVAILFAASTHFAIAQNNISETKQDSVVTESFKVKGITCANDIKTICSNIEMVKGVKSCNNSKPGAVTTFTVSFNSFITTKKDIIKAIEDTPCCKDPDERPYKVKQ